MTRSLILLIATAMLMTACQSFPLQKKTNPLDPLEPGVGAGTAAIVEPGLHLAPDQRFSDVPLPVGVKPDLEHTFVYETPALQIGKMVYTTKATIFEAAQFFLKECPTAGWTLESSIEAAGVDLFFRKGGKRLTVSIRDLTGTGRGRTITLTLVPEG